MAVDSTDVATILHTDGIIPNPAYRSDSPAHKPPGTNAFVAWQTLAIEAASNGAAALAQSKLNAAAIEKIAQAVTALTAAQATPAAIAAGVVAALGPDAQISPEELEAALLSTFARLAQQAQA